MTQLGQQELMEAGPRRRIIVPRGHVAHWGVDPSTRRVAVAGVSRTADGWLTRWVRQASFEPVEGLERLSGIYTATYALVDALLADPSIETPGVVWVEQPGGEHRNYPLFYATGVIAAAMGNTLAAHGVSARFEAVVPASWKKTACGKGNIYKPKKGSDEVYGVLAWARENDYDGTSWDEADAWGIAEAARREVELVQR